MLNKIMATILVVCSVMLISAIEVSAAIINDKFKYRGYNYSNSKKCDTSYSWANYPGQFEIDMKDMKASGANFVRLYYRVELDKSEYDRYMEMAQKSGMKVMILFWVDYGLDYSFKTGSSNRERVIREYVNMVTRLKEYKTIAAFGFGSENNYFLGDKTSKWDWFKLVNEAAKQAKRTGARQKFYTSNGEIADLVQYKDIITSLDWFGATIYRPDKQAIQAINEQYAPVKKPLIITEYGKDSLYRGKIDEAGQAALLLEFTKAYESLRNVIGVTVFSFEDGWNKSGNPCQHDDEIIQPLSGISYISDRLDNRMSEEWLGITYQIAQNQTTSRRKKRAYWALQKYWAEPQIKIKYN